VALVLGGATGCFREKSHPIRYDRIVRAHPAPSPPDRPETTRAWLESTHAQLRDLLPPLAHRAMLTEDLTDRDGRPVDVFRHFRIHPAYLSTLVGNLSGLMDTAEASRARDMIDVQAPPWPDFEDVWIPINDHLSLSGRLGHARRGGQIIEADCIVVLPGLLGDKCALRTRDLCAALLESGFHVLALEMRAHGQTEARYPNVYYDWGVLETGDLLEVSEWLVDRPAVRRTGLVGFCWGANHALLAAWEDGRPEDHPSIRELIRPHLRPRDGRRHFEAGVVAFSPVLNFEEIIDKLERDWSIAADPVLCALQDTVEARMLRKRHPTCSGSLKDLIYYETLRTVLDYPGAVADGLDYLRLMPYRGKPAGDKLESARVPVLIVYAANDPLAPAQEVADLFSTLRNPNVAGIILPGGGHIGFAPYATRYYYSLLLNFFDPKTGAAAGG
jgi:predicted alpha/beta-fold hydrolase